MLRILTGILLSGTLLSGPVAASSFLEPATGATQGRSSFLVIDATREVAPPVDPTTTASYADDDAPMVIEAPRFVRISRSITALAPTVGESQDTGLVAIDDDEADAQPAPELARARQTSPMVIRGGLVGHAFPGETRAPAPADETEGERTVSAPPARSESRVEAPASTRSESRPEAAPRPSAPARQSSPPPPRYEQPAAPPTGLPM